MYRLALLSNAMHQDGYTRAFAAHPRVRLVAVVDEPGQEPYVAGRNRTMADTYGVPYVESLDALDSAQIDAVSVGAQIERRARLAEAAARLGKHLWLDKPPAATGTQAEAVAAAVDAAGVRSLVFSHLAAPWVATLRRTIEGGEVGDLLALHLDFHFAKGTAAGLDGRRVPSGTGPRAVWTFRDPAAATDPTESSHNVIAKRELAEVGWYPLALARHLCPQPVRRVFATTGTYFFPEHHDLGLEDFATVSLALEGGPAITISTGRTGRNSHPAGRMAVRAVGTRGTLVVDGGQPALLVHGGEAPGVTLTGAAGGAAMGRRPTISAWGDSTGVPALVEHFVACLDGLAPPLLTARQGCELVHLLDAAYSSAASGQPVTP